LYASHFASGRPCPVSSGAISTSLPKLKEELRNLIAEKKEQFPDHKSFFEGEQFSSGEETLKNDLKAIRKWGRQRSA
jgi:hypothetical protein